MTVDYSKFNWVGTPIAASIPDVVSWLEQFIISPSTLYAAIDLANAFFSIPVNKDQHKQFASNWQGQKYIFSVLMQGYINSPAICHNLVHRDLDCLAFPKDITLVHYINDIMLMGPNEQEIAATLVLLLRHLCVRG